MATVNAIRVKNLRNLVDTEWIELKPLTILVGKNSSGKSTFARVFPLLKQSARERKQSPILWFGQHVDFGEYSIAAGDKSTSNYISFGFKLNLTSNDFMFPNYPTYHLAQTANLKKHTSLSLEYELCLEKGPAEGAADTLVKNMAISLLGNKINIDFSNANVASISINDFNGIDKLDVWKKDEEHTTQVTFNAAMPGINFYLLTNPAALESKEGKKTFYFKSHNPFQGKLKAKIKANIHGNSGGDRVNQIASDLTLRDDSNFIENARAAGKNDKAWDKYINTLVDKPEKLNELKRLVICYHIPEIFEMIDVTLREHHASVRYIEPLRATAQRYYRKQDLAIAEIDSRGANVVQFLHGLSWNEKNAFDELSMRLFGFTVKAQGSGGHIELVLKQRNSNEEVNLADAGVGFSQLLPILLQFWGPRNKRTSSKDPLFRFNSTTLVVEQPELHLHPAYQATLADLFCETISVLGMNNIQVIAETHSAALVNRLGILIAKEKVKATDVQILLFEQKDERGPTTIRTATFDKDGSLSNWPYGFFEPEV